VEKEEEDEDEEENKDEDDGKEPQMIGHGEMVITSDDNVDLMVVDQPIVLPEQGQEMRQFTPPLQPPVPAPWAQTPEPCLQLQSLMTHPISGLEHLGLVTSQKPHPTVPTL
jgi:hypothetical protein